MTVSTQPAPASGVDCNFDEDFYIALDPATLALDFWSYLNAQQARLGWTPSDDRVWDYLEELEHDLEPLLEALPDEPSLLYLRRMAQLWVHGDQEGERGALRHRIAEMLSRALETQADLARTTTTVTRAASPRPMTNKEHGHDE